MFSVQYIPLSVRVRSWSLSLFNQETLESFLNEDTNSIINTVAKKERIYPIETSSYIDFVHSMEQTILEYLNVASKTSNGASRSFIRELFHYFEIQNLKNIVRMSISGKFQDVLYPHSFTEELTLKKLSEIRSIGELINLLEHTPYRSLKSTLEQTELEQNSLYWELALDNYFVSRIVHVTKRLDIDSKKAIKELILDPLQKDRIVSLYRYRFHYQVEASEAAKYVPNLSACMHLNDWNQLVFSVSALEFHSYLVQLGYLSPETPNYATAINQEFQKQLEKRCHKLLRKDLTSISSFLAFFQLKQIQFRKIITILESKNLQVSLSDVMQFL